MMNPLVLIFSLIGLGVVVACSNATETKKIPPSGAQKSTANPVVDNAPTNEVKAAPEEQVVEVPANLRNALKVVVEATDTMQFNVKEIRVTKGRMVSLTLKHVGTIGKAAMGHNLVILKKGVDMAAFAQAALGAKDEDYLPTQLADSVLAATKLLGGGESDTIVFKAPAPGVYDFFCSFPGHYAVMKGQLIVE